jgi:hypothetical protein
MSGEKLARSLVELLTLGSVYYFFGIGATCVTFLLLMHGNMLARERR